MGFLVNTLSVFFLTVLIASLPIQARQSKFFHKVTLMSTTSTNNKVTPQSQISTSPSLAPTPAPTPTPTPEAEPTIAAEPVPAPAEAPASFYADNGSGYGLYGHGSDQIHPTKKTVTADHQNDLLSEELSAENYDSAGYQNNNYNNNGYTGTYKSNGYVPERQGMSDTSLIGHNDDNNNLYARNYNTNDYENEKKGMSDTRFINNNYDSNIYDNDYKHKGGYTGNGGYTNGYSSRNYNTNGYENEKQGMSDTRFLENGKYYHEVKSDQNSYNPNGSGSERGTATSTSEGYYGNGHNVNEFNNMEEFENQQEYQERPEEFVP